MLSEKRINKIRKNPDKQNWVEISMHQKLSEEFIIEFADKLKWSYVFMFQNLSSNILIRFKNKIDWKYTSIAQSQKLSEEFMEELKDYLNWKDISLYQKMSKKFVEKHICRLNLFRVIYNDGVDEETKNYIRMFI